MAFSLKNYKRKYPGVEKHPSPNHKTSYLYRGYRIKQEWRGAWRAYPNGTGTGIASCSSYTLAGVLDYIEYHLPALCKECGKRLYHTNPELLEEHGLCFDCWTLRNDTHTKE